MADTQTTTGTTSRKTARRRSASTKRRAAKKASRALNGNTRAMIEDGASRAYRSGRRMAKRAYSAAGDAMRDVHLPDRRQLERFADQNPLVLGAVGLGLGVVIGTLLPRYGNLMPSATSASHRSASRRKR